MTQSSSVFHLNVQQVEQTCLFELCWGQGQRLRVMLPYPETLKTLYQEWSSVYLKFYDKELRGRVAAAGSIAPPPVDWHAKLVQAEASLLYEFHRWLRQGELFDIYTRIAQAAWDKEKGKTSLPVEVFLTCNPLEIARLPWEAWEIGTELAAKGKIRFIRTAPNIHKATVAPRNRRRARILAILGDDTGLDFQTDKEAVRSLNPIADIEFVGWQPGEDTNALRAKIVEKISDEQGWDVLFFAGHSNETVLTGGELAIAPGVSLFLKEIEQPLLLAIERGLQFALFNSCNGLSLANALINLGLSQVAVMREPIHNRVAQEFLVQFLQHLAEYKDVHESLLAACQYLNVDNKLTYPSAYLIPSLFRHPEAPLFRLKPNSFIDKIKGWLPTKQEAIALAALALVSWQLPVQNYLSERRVLAQAVYRQQTAQVTKQTPPPLLLVQIDDQSIVEAGIKNPNPMDRTYLSKLVDKLSALKAKVVGIDYLLDRQHGESDRLLAQSLEKAVQQQQTWFVFAANKDDADQWVGVLPKIASLDWTLQGDMNLLESQGRLGYMRLVPNKDASSRNLPFSYLTALAYRLNLEPGYSPPQPQSSPSKTALAYDQQLTPNSPTAEGTKLNSLVSVEVKGVIGKSSENDFLSQLTGYLDRKQQNYTTLLSPNSRRQAITEFAYQLGQMWLQPIIDFSVPPDQIYQRISAYKFLQMPADAPQLKSLNQRAVMIVPGGYGDNPGVSLEGQDNFLVPAAVKYWRTQQNSPDSRQYITGGEAHAYLFHNFLRNRLIVPIPDLWMVGVAALLGKGCALTLQHRRRWSRQWGTMLLVAVTASYGLVSLQIYISAAVLLPWLLPSVTLWTFMLPVLIKKKNNA